MKFNEKFYLDFYGLWVASGETKQDYCEEYVKKNPGKTVDTIQRWILKGQKIFESREKEMEPVNKENRVYDFLSDFDGSFAIPLKVSFVEKFINVFIETGFSLENVVFNEEMEKMVLIFCRNNKNKEIKKNCFGNMKINDEEYILFIDELVSYFDLGER